MVSDSIVVHTQPAAGSGAHVWTGLLDGTYTLEPLEEPGRHGGDPDRQARHGALLPAPEGD